MYTQNQECVLTSVRACSVVSLGLSCCKTSSVVCRALSLHCNTKEDCCCRRIFNRSLRETEGTRRQRFSDSMTDLITGKIVGILSAQRLSHAVPRPDETSASFQPDYILIEFRCRLLLLLSFTIIVLPGGRAPLRGTEC